VTHLRKMMLEELQRRNYAQHTTRSYIRTVEDFARHFHCSPDRLGHRHIREYQADLFERRKLSASSVAVRLAALRFFYCKTLKRTWSIADTPYPKGAPTRSVSLCIGATHSVSCLEAIYHWPLRNHGPLSACRVNTLSRSNFTTSRTPYFGRWSELKKRRKNLRDFSNRALTPTDSNWNLAEAATSSFAVTWESNV